MSDAAYDEEEEKKPYEYIEQTLCRKVHHYYISSTVGEAAGYAKMIHGILNAPAEDTIHIHLNTPGGDLSAGVQIVNAMKSSAATIVCSIEGEACSLGSLIFLAADQFIVHDDAIMLIHNLSHGVYGKGKESSMQMDATLKWFKALAEKYYIPFLTDKELEQVLDDKDKWFTSAEIRRRLNKMIKIKKRELKELEEAE
jgi:ATP-dependent protease ClpP protease subunit